MNKLNAHRARNATLFKQGYDSILNPHYASGTVVKAKAGDQWTDWTRSLLVAEPS